MSVLLVCHYDILVMFVCHCGMCVFECITMTATCAFHRCAGMALARLYVLMCSCCLADVSEDDDADVKMDADTSLTEAGQETKLTDFSLCEQVCDITRRSSPLPQHRLDRLSGWLSHRLAQADVQ